MPADDDERLDEALLIELFGRSYPSRAEAVAAIRHLPPDELQLLNETVLPLFGIGEDSFFLNELFQNDRTLLDFATVREYDECDFQFQEEWRKKEDANYSGKPYRGSLYMSWARLFVDGRFTYVTLSMAAGYLYGRLESAGSDLIEQRIPHRHVPGRNHGKTEGENWQWDMRVDANGQEGILDELQRRTWNYQYQRWESLLSAYDAEAACGVYLLDESELPEERLHVVFTDIGALSAVRFRSFIRDCRALKRTNDEIDTRLEVERSALERFIDEQLADIRRTYDPKVARFEKRRKVMVRKDAFE